MPRDLRISFFLSSIVHTKTNDSLPQIKMISKTLLAAMAGVASAFPAAMLEAAARDPALAARTAEMTKLINRNKLAGRQTGADSATAIFEAVPTFNAAEQYVDVSEGSANAWVAPGEGDLRGPCPGMFKQHKLPEQLVY